MPAANISREKKGILSLKKKKIKALNKTKFISISKIQCFILSYAVYDVNNINNNR